MTGSGRVPAIAAGGLVRTFGRTRAVDGVDLTIEQGTVFGLLGPNGAGKTTIVRTPNSVMGVSIMVKPITLYLYRRKR